MSSNDRMMVNDVLKVIRRKRLWPNFKILRHLHRGTEENNEIPRDI